MAVDQRILREYLVALGYRVDEKESKTFDATLMRNTKAAALLGKTLGTVATAIVGMTHLFAKQMERMYYSARYADTTVERLQSLEFGAKQIGLEAGNASVALRNFSSSIRSNPGLLGLLNSLGVQVTGRDKADVMLDMVKALKQMPFYVAERYAQLFGMDAETLFNLQQGLEELKKAQEVRKQMALDMGLDADAAAKMATEYMKMWREVTERAGIFGQVVATAVMPEVKALMELTNQLLIDWTKIAQEISVKGSSGFWQKFKEGLWGSASGPRVSLNKESRARIGAPQEDQTPATPGTFSHYWNKFWFNKRNKSRPWTDDAAVDAVTTPVEIRPGGGTPSGTSQNPPKTDGAPPADVKDPQGLFSRLEGQYGLPKGLLDKVWELESARGRARISKKGAEGHFGFMPKTQDAYGLVDPYNLEESADAAARMWKDLLRQYNGDIRKAAAGYNWGSGNLARYGLGAAPKETREYMDSVSSAVKVDQQTNINIHGVTNPAEAGKAVAAEQRSVNAEIVRNFAPKVR